MPQQQSSDTPNLRVPSVVGLLWRRIALGAGLGLGATVLLVLAVGFVHGQPTLAYLTSEADFFETVRAGISKLAGRSDYWPRVVGLGGALCAAAVGFLVSGKALEKKLDEAIDLVYLRLQTASGRERQAFSHGLGMFRLYKRALASERTVLRLAGIAATVVAGVALAFETPAAYIIGTGIGLAAFGVSIVLTLPNDQVKCDVEEFLLDQKHGVKDLPR